MAKGKKKQRAGAAGPPPEPTPLQRTGAVRQIDLHGYTADEATEVVRAALRSRAPGQMVQFITGVGNHSVDSIPVLKLRLTAMFEAWSVRSQWHRGIFTVVVPGTATLERMGWQVDICSGSGQSNVRVASREEVELARARAGTNSIAPQTPIGTTTLGRTHSSEFPSLATAAAIHQAQRCDPMTEAIRLSKVSAKRERRKMTQRARSHGNTPEEDPADAAALAQALAASRVEATNVMERECHAKLAADEEEEAMAMAIARSLQARSPDKNNDEDDAALALAIARSLQEAEDRVMARERDEMRPTLSVGLFQFAEEARRMAEEAWALEEQHTQLSEEAQTVLHGAAESLREGGSMNDNEMAMGREPIASSIKEGGMVKSNHKLTSPHLEPEPEPEPEPESKLEPETDGATISCLDAAALTTVGAQLPAKVLDSVSAISPWVRFVCDSRAYHWHMETEQLSLAPPVEGVVDEVPVPKGEFDPVYADAAAQAPAASFSTVPAAVKSRAGVQHGAGQANEQARLKSFLAVHRQTELERVLLAHGITDIQAFARLTEGDLRTMGVAKGPRVKLLRTVGEWLTDATVPSERMETGPELLADFKLGSDEQHGAGQANEQARLKSFLAVHRQTELERVLLAHGITDIQAFARLTEGDLRTMGVAKGPRVKLLRTVGEWLTDATVPSERMETGPELLAVSSLHCAIENNTQQQGVDLAAALFTQAEQLAAGVQASLRQPVHDFNTDATAMVGDKPPSNCTVGRPQPTTLSVRTVSASSVAVALGASANHASQARPAQNEPAVLDANIGKMMELGFDAGLSRKALLACGGELRSALEWALASRV